MVLGREAFRHEGFGVFRALGCRVWVLGCEASGFEDFGCFVAMEGDVFSALTRVQGLRFGSYWLGRFDLKPSALNPNPPGPMGGCVHRNSSLQHDGYSSRVLLRL